MEERCRTREANLALNSRWLLIKYIDFEQVPVEELYLLCRVYSLV